MNDMIACNVVAMRTWMFHDLILLIPFGIDPKYSTERQQDFDHCPSRSQN
jgi:hypothetical protein